ncbi:MAG: enoyl-ACP reductase [Planctomycetes bacterium]|nr:enoyl-ACP reductase [Planctomycetota bacterium]
MLKGRKGIILGVANKRSLAWACAKSCAERGAEVALTYQNERFQEGVQSLASTLPGASATIPLIRCDVTRDEDLDALADSVKTQFGTIDFIVHSIAFANPQELKNPFRQTTREGFRNALDISAYSLIAVSRALAPLMPNGGGIVTLSYVGGERVVPNYNVMGAAKAALDSCARYLAYDLGPQGIRVNSVAPGVIRTLSASGIADLGKMLEQVERTAPLRRNVSAEEVGDTVAFFVSEMARGITGQTIHVDSGYSILGVSAIDPQAMS